MLEHLFGSKTRLKLLQIFLNNTEKSFYVRELARLAGAQLNAVRREIANLEKTGLIVQTPPSSDAEGGERCKYYRFDTTSVLFPEFRDLLIKVQIIEEREFVEEIRKRGGKVNFMLLTGCFTDDKKAETDLLVVGDIKPQSVAKIIHEYEKNIGRELKYTILSESEFFDRREIGDRFLYGLFESKHNVVIDEYRATGN